jgi:hypothetical protein
MGSPHNFAELDWRPLGTPTSLLASPIIDASMLHLPILMSGTTAKTDLPSHTSVDSLLNCRVEASSGDLVFKVTVEAIGCKRKQ